MIRKLKKINDYFKCVMCGKQKMGKSYIYQNTSFVRDYIPPILDPICRDCIYREVYGTKKMNKKKKEGSLDK